MTDETKKLFDAPWTVADDKDEQGRYMTMDNDMACVAKESTLKDANRHACLPELYDELQRMVYVECTNACERKEPCDKPCDVVRPAVELLKKVRDGE